MFLPGELLNLHRICVLFRFPVSVAHQLLCCTSLCRVKHYSRFIFATFQQLFCTMHPFLAFSSGPILSGRIPVLHASLGRYSLVFCYPLHVSLLFDLSRVSSLLILPFLSFFQSFIAVINLHCVDSRVYDVL